MPVGTAQGSVFVHQWISTDRTAQNHGIIISNYAVFT
jgi:hypothetical protein